MSRSAAAEASTTPAKAPRGELRIDLRPKTPEVPRFDQEDAEALLGLLNKRPVDQSDIDTISF